jgi:hypothetical protein
MRPHEIVASVEAARWEIILTTVREQSTDLWRSLERATIEDQRIPRRLWQRYPPAERQTRMRRALLAPANMPLAIEVLREYLMAAHRPLIIRFLDLLELPHTEGVLPDGQLPTPEPARLEAAIDTLLAEFPRAEVLLYLRLLALQEATAWPGLAERLAAEAARPAPAAADGPTQDRAVAASSATATPAEEPRHKGRAAERQPPATSSALSEPATARDVEPPDVRAHTAYLPPLHLSAPGPSAGGPAEALRAEAGPRLREPAPSRTRRGAAAPAPAAASSAAAPRSAPRGGPRDESHRPPMPPVPVRSGALRAATSGEPGRAAGLPVLRPALGAEPPGLTALDRLLARAVSAAGHPGADATEGAELRAALDEVLALSAERPRSAYPLGLLAALTAAAGAEAPEGWGPAHRAWYERGRLAGWTQREQWSAVVRFVTEEAAAARALLADEPPLARWAAAHLFDALLTAGEPVLAAEVLGCCPAVATLPARTAVLEAASALLAGDRVGEADAVLTALASLPPLAAPDVAPPEMVAPHPVVAGTAEVAAAAYAARLARRVAECAQAQGCFAVARARLEAALPTADGTERGCLLAALGLVAGEFSRLADVRLPEADADPQPWRRRLEAGEPYFREALEAAPDDLPTASFCLGALEWLRGRPGGAREHFEAAVYALGRQPAAVRPAGVLAQAEFYLGACLLLDLDTAARQRALSLLRTALDDGLVASPAVWRRLLDEVVALDATLADALFDLFALQERTAPGLPADLVRDYLMRCAVRSEVARQRLAAECARPDLPAAERWPLLCRLLEAQRRAGDADGVRATLDALEGLSLAPAEDSRARLERWRDFLADPANYEPEWSWEEVLWSRLRTLELLGHDEEAFWLLAMPFNRALAEGTAESLAEAEDLLAHARQLARSPDARGAVADMAQRLRARQEALRAEAAAEEDVVGARLRAGRSLRVLFIGGNETQAQYEAALRAALERRDETTGARVQIEFRTPGYNSNWDKTLEAVRGYRGRVDALVLMPYVRTQLGRALRRLASEWGVPWVSCTGKGYDSLERSLRAAIVLAARQ